MRIAGLGRNPLHPELPFVELAGFHDEPHALESCDIRQGIAVDCDEIRFKPRRDGADQVLQIHRLGAVRGQIDQRLHRLLAEPDALDGFSGIPSMRACVGVCAHHHLESGRPQCPREAAIRWEPVPVEGTHVGNVTASV